MCIYTSRHLMLLRAFLVALLALAVAAALMSQFITPVGWTLLLVLMVLVGATVWFTCHLGSVRAPELLHRLWIEQGVWRLDSARSVKGVSGARREERFILTGEVLLWPWVIIFELRPLATAGLSPEPKNCRMVILRDSVTERDFRALSRWLRLCVHRQADRQADR